MIIGPRYKIARRLGAPVFDKTRTQKFAATEGGKKTGRPGKGFGGKTEFGTQLIEKQKARMLYGVSEKQFAKYVGEAMKQKTTKPAQKLFETLEMRLDNAVYRLGFIASKQMARQMVSHGHFLVNGKRVDVPSYQVSVGDKITAREGSKKSPLFINIADRVKGAMIPAWIRFDAGALDAEIIGTPKYEGTDLMFNMGAILEFYSR